MALFIIVSFCSNILGDGLAACMAYSPDMANTKIDLQAMILVDGPAGGQISYAWPDYYHPDKLDDSKINVRVYTDFKHNECYDLLHKALTE